VQIGATFFRRLDWSPEGHFLTTTNSFEAPSHTAAVVERGIWEKVRGVTQTLHCRQLFVKRKRNSDCGTKVGTVQLFGGLHCRSLEDRVVEEGKWSLISGLR
jgi:hypothetical protein